MATSQSLPTGSRAEFQASSAVFAEPRISGIRGLASLWHLASLDAPTVAVVWCLVFAWVAGVPLPLWLLVVLGLSTWVFYIADRLFDVRRSIDAPRSFPNGGVLPKAAMESTRILGDLQPRHHFHWRHRRIFVPTAIAAAGVALALVLFWMPWAARARNSLLAAAALVYFTSVHRPRQLAMPRFRLPKELLVGILFTLACALPAWTRMTENRAQPIPLVLSFVALAWLNCQAIETWESASESESILRPAMALAAFALVLAALSAFEHQPRSAAMLAAAALSAALLALLDRNRSRIRSRLGPTALRSAADLVLLTPLALLAFR